MSDERRYTPGPWRYEGDGWVAVDDPDNQDRNGHCVPICTIRGAQGHQIDANGALIAAAPDLLASLQECVNIGAYLANCSTGRKEPEWLVRARAAIAKALGKDQPNA